ncbi:MAG: Ig-like domain-containing protein, partial [Bacteroidales bacterium]|nr:Ig-like domain-containing protein [Bacteroidales bacterium]
VATVAEDGTVTGVKAGNATITCTTKDQSKKATCSVTVKAATVAVTGVELKSTLTMNIGGTYTLTATVKPENATNKNVTWKTSDASIVTVSEGKLTAVKKGTATITVTTKDGSKTATCTVTVKDIRWYQTQGAGSSTSLGAGGANPDPQTYTYIMGSTTGTLGDAMKFFLNNGPTDSDESHWKYQVLSNDGSIETKKTKESNGYSYTVTFKKNGHAKVRLSYDNGEFSLTQDVNFDVYLDGSGKWKFQYRINSGSWKDYTGGNLTAKLSDKNINFRVVTTSGSTISDINESHYRIYDWWPDAHVIETSVNPQTTSGNNWCIMWVLFQKADYTFVELSYTDGTYMIACEHFRLTVTN